MKKSNFYFTDKLGEEIYCYMWEPSEKPKAIVQFLHGMTENSTRYDEVAERMVSDDFICVSEDHYGHGKTAPNREQLGIIPGNWQDIAKDIHKLTLVTSEKYPNLPIYLLAFSWGSFFAQYYMQEWGDKINGCILIGTNGNEKMMGFLLFLTKIISFFKGKDSNADLMVKLTFGKYNDYFSPTKTDFDWLSRDEQAVDKFIEDPYCGFIPSNKFYIEMIELLQHIWKPENEVKIPKDLPIFMLSGEKDSVSLGGRRVKKLIERYRKNGVNNIESKFYKEARHDLLHEINKDEVISDILSWLNKKYNKNY